MMSGMRKAGQSWLGRIVVAVLFGFLILSFGIWGIGDMIRSVGHTNVAQVGSTEISALAYRDAYQNEMQQLSRRIQFLSCRNVRSRNPPCKSNARRNYDDARQQDGYRLCAAQQQEHRREQYGKNALHSHDPEGQWNTTVAEPFARPEIRFTYSWWGFCGIHLSPRTQGARSIERAMVPCNKCTDTYINVGA